MIVVDTTVWIDFFNGLDAPHVRRLRGLFGVQEIVIGDLMLCEVLQGLRDEHAAQAAEREFRRFSVVTMGGEALAKAAARNYRALRSKGITIRKTIDVLIATWCIENRCALLHHDRDFDPFVRHMGLIEIIV